MKLLVILQVSAVCDVDLILFVNIMLVDLVLRSVFNCIQTSLTHTLKYGKVSEHAIKQQQQQQTQQQSRLNASDLPSPPSQIITSQHVDALLYGTSLSALPRFAVLLFFVRVLIHINC